VDDALTERATNARLEFHAVPTQFYFAHQLQEHGTDLRGVRLGNRLPEPPELGNSGVDLLLHTGLVRPPFQDGQLIGQGLAFHFPTPYLVGQVRHQVRADDRQPLDTLVNLPVEFGGLTLELPGLDDTGPMPRARLPPYFLAKFLQVGGVEEVALNAADDAIDQRRFVDGVVKTNGLAVGVITRTQIHPAPMAVGGDHA
jgi:hypothetical protein